MKFRPLFLLFCLLVATSACTIQKRTVNTGYFVQWHLNFKQRNEAPASVSVSFSGLKPADSLVTAQKGEIPDIPAETGTDPFFESEREIVPLKSKMPKYFEAIETKFKSPEQIVRKDKVKTGEEEISHLKKQRNSSFTSSFIFFLVFAASYLGMLYAEYIGFFFLIGAALFFFLWAILLARSIRLNKKIEKDTGKSGQRKVFLFTACMMAFISAVFFILAYHSILNYFQVIAVYLLILGSIALIASIVLFISRSKQRADVKQGN